VEENSLEDRVTELEKFLDFPDNIDHNLHVQHHISQVIRDELKQTAVRQALRTIIAGGVVLLFVFIGLGLQEYMATWPH